MSYRFKTTDKTVPRGLRRIARKQLDASLAILDAAPVPDAAGLHELRRTVKRMRGLLRLVRPAFDDFNREDSCLRDAGRQVAGLRDRDAMLIVFDQLTGGTPDPELHDALSVRLSHAAPDAVAAAQAHRALLADQRARIEDWRFAGRDFAILAPGLEDELDRARRLLRDWRRHHDEEAMHELRKAVKAHGFHAALLAPIWPEMMLPHQQQTARLGELLGLARDHGLIAEHLDDLPGGEELALRARAQVATLQGEAILLARRLLAESGASITRRWGAWWDLWRDA